MERTYLTVKKQKQLKVKYVYLKPKNPEEKRKQQEILDDIFTIIFDEMAKKEAKA